ncbi:TPA: helix-turn-helix domain-containing protein [Bacillus thuringiensis]|nr:helix-turn-helix domain-containing protein [Bacillus thuringiensis]
MSKLIFNEIQMKQLEKNENVVKVSECSIAYCADFKIKVGKGPNQIFLESGFNLEVIGKKTNQRLKNWRKTYEQFGEEGLYTEHRGKGSTRHPSTKMLSSDDKLKKAEAHIAFLEAELAFLKKLDKLER